MKERNKSKKEVVIIAIAGIVVLVLAIFLITLSIRKDEAQIMHYSDTSELDYNVYLKQNDFYNTPFLPKNRVYVSTLIDYVDTFFNYAFNVTEDVNLGYTYYITAQVVVEGNSDKKIYDEEEILVEKKELQEVSNKEFSISENVKIDYDRYNQLASSFVEKYDISAKARIIVSMYVEIEGTTEKFEKKLNDSAVVSFEIPLTTKTTEIKMNYDLTNNSNEVFEYGKTKLTNPVLFIVAICIAIIDIGWVLSEEVTYILNKDAKVKYQEKIKKIFRDYGNYISKKSITAKTKEIMYTVSLRVEVVNSFDDLINVRDNLEKPILFYESVPGDQAIFYIIDTKVTYIYIMNAKDFEKKKGNKEDAPKQVSSHKESLDKLFNNKYESFDFDEIALPKRKDFKPINNREEGKEQFKSNNNNQEGKEQSKPNNNNQQGKEQSKPNNNNQEGKEQSKPNNNNQQGKEQSKPNNNNQQGKEQSKPNNNNQEGKEQSKPNNNNQEDKERFKPNDKH